MVAEGAGLCSGLPLAQSKDGESVPQFPLVRCRQ